MNTQELVDTAGALIAGNKRLLAMDESNTTCNKRFVVRDFDAAEMSHR